MTEHGLGSPMASGSSYKRPTKGSQSAHRLQIDNKRRGTFSTKQEGVASMMTPVDQYVQLSPVVSDNESTALFVEGNFKNLLAE